MLQCLLALALILLHFGTFTFGTLSTLTYWTVHYNVINNATTLRSVIKALQTIYRTCWCVVIVYIKPCRLGLMKMHVGSPCNSSLCVAPMEVNHTNPPSRRSVFKFCFLFFVRQLISPLGSFSSHHLCRLSFSGTLKTAASLLTSRYSLPISAITGLFNLHSALC